MHAPFDLVGLRHCFLDYEMNKKRAQLLLCPLKIYDEVLGINYFESIFSIGIHNIWDTRYF